jgi:NifU-like protein involved in Fe-S cluster formation
MDSDQIQHFKIDGVTLGTVGCHIAQISVESMTDRIENRTFAGAGDALEYDSASVRKLQEKVLMLSHIC